MVSPLGSTSVWSADCRERFHGANVYAAWPYRVLPWRIQDPPCTTALAMVIAQRNTQRGPRRRGPSTSQGDGPRLPGLRTNLMIGFPHETRQDVLLTLWFGLRMALMGVDDVPFFFSAYPGTEIFEGLLKDGVVDRNGWSPATPRTRVAFRLTLRHALPTYQVIQLIHGRQRAPAAFSAREHLPMPACTPWAEKEPPGRSMVVVPPVRHPLKRHAALLSCRRQCAETNARVHGCARPRDGDPPSCPLVASPHIALDLSQAGFSQTPLLPRSCRRNGLVPRPACLSS